MNICCQHCNAKHFPGEILANRRLSFNDCCSHGGVEPHSFMTFSRILKSLFTRTHEYSNEFLNNIRVYNSSLSFASFNANLMNFSGKRPGPYCFKVKGHIYYQINTALYPEPNQDARYGQLFILDPAEANQIRLGTFSGLNHHILKILDKLIRSKNKYAKSYRMMKDEIRRLQRKSTPIPEVIMSFIPKSGLDSRRYNPQRSNEVAAIFTTTVDGDIPDTFVTIRNVSTSQLEYVSWMDKKVEPWIYPLFYPYGEDGWHEEMKRLDSTRRITRSAYLKNLIAVRNEFNPFLRGGRLFQQWLVDSYVKIEKDRITYCRSHQKELRSETYQGVIDHMRSRAMDNNAKIGRMIILPSTFIGSPRNMAQNYQDAMAIVRKFGKPDLFITMTCNPNWREIQENLETGQQPQDRPDIVARVFNLKKDFLLTTLLQDKIFGKVGAWVYVIEFQKRGLPHMHLLVTLCRNYKITCPDVVDRIISAEIPHQNEEPILYEIVMRNMIHGPCGDWCLVQNKCSKHFPKPFQSRTTMDKNGYPCYQRKDTGKYHERPHGYVVDNRFVVPYSRVLLRKLNCHCNVEVVSSIKSVKYLFKYIYKGHDAASITMRGQATNIEEIIHDEINEHIEARYVGPVEACWRILSKKLHDKSHPVIRMPVHLPNQQNITIHTRDEDLTLNHILEQKNMLLDYFALNKRIEVARNYLYTEIPQHFVFQKKKVNNVYTSKWKKRKSAFKTIGRMYSVNPSQKELFHLRLLLLTVKGATSYEDLRTVNGTLASSFTEACLKRGLIADDSEWHRAMHEAEVWMMPLQMRRLFTRILIHCDPLYPENLWNDFKLAMSEDFLRRGMDTISAENEALRQIYSLLENEGKNLSDFPSMPPPLEINMNRIDERNYEVILEAGLTHYRQLNEKQKIIVDYILNCIDNPNLERTLYVDGPGGSGKTFLYITLWHLLTGQHKKVTTMAYTGIAATLLPNGRTVHKTLGLPVPLYADFTSTIKIGSKEAKVLEETDMFIWDEAPMAPRYALEIMDKILQDVMNNTQPFGGKIVILGGDFRQLLPVNIRSTRSETVNSSIKFSVLWCLFRIFKLTTNMRTLPEEIEFSEFLLRVGTGDLNDDDDNLNLPPVCTCHNDIDIAKDIYENILQEKKFKAASTYAILAARNSDVNEINQQVVDLLDVTTEHIYTSVDSAENCNETDEICQDLVPEYLNSLSPNDLPPYELRLRKYSIIMLIRNLSINEGLVNGTRLLLLEAGTNLLRCELLTGDKAGDIIFLNRITLTCEDIYPFSFTRRQFPIKLAFAITINKSQGQTFERIGIDLRKDVFNHGQLYVALSRVRAWQSLKIYLGTQRRNNSVKNYVYKELFN